ncbi:hypothetical protein FBALC1_17142 [Flavobacteriales bacterium ALC-1]|nr:hypothetical protein FBALC1_17142 [Flavobacteriales bacterium ALC-1]
MCMIYENKNSSLVDTKGNIIESGVKKTDAPKKIKDYQDVAKKEYPNLSEEEALARYLEELIEIKNLKRVVISEVNDALVDSKGFIRVFGDFIDDYKRLINYPQKNEIIEKGKNALKNDPKKQRYIYNNSDTPNVPYSEFEISPTFKGMEAYLKNGKFGNGIIPKGDEVYVKQIQNLIEKHKGETRTFVTGDRPSDFKNCWRSIGVTDNKLINKYQEICRKMKLTWHHLDDLDGSLKSTFQLVYTPLHKRTTPHMGSNAQLLEIFNQLKKQ